MALRATTLRPWWRQGFRYFKVAVVLDDLRDAAAEPTSLFPTRDPARWPCLGRPHGSQRTLADPTGYGPDAE